MLKIKSGSKKVRHSEIENSITSTFFNQSIWNFVEITFSLVLDIAGKSAWLNQNSRCYTILYFWECLSFFDSDFTFLSINFEISFSFAWSQKMAGISDIVLQEVILICILTKI